MVGFYLLFEKNVGAGSIDELLPETQSGPSKASRMDNFAAIFNGS